MDLTFFADCPKCKAPGPHYAEYREGYPPSEDHREITNILTGGGRVLRSDPVIIGHPGIPDHTWYDCTNCHHEWRQ